MIPINMRKIKMGMPVFLKKNSPAKPIIMMPATTPKTRDASTILCFAQPSCLEGSLMFLPI